MRNKLFLIAVLLSMILLPAFAHPASLFAKGYRQRWAGTEG
ncbi:hypothetical protein PMI08_03393 [Brevibacillus sp. CF112]|nr:MULTISPECIES: hypothetical protein [Brevibacillus]EJL42222.1 hypothetical protein PMI08_03393 [Brevibacillus sp. CF112]